MKHKPMKRINFDREKVLHDRLQLIKERHKKLILEPRRKVHSEIVADVFMDDDECESLDDLYDLDLARDAESELL